MTIYLDNAATSWPKPPAVYETLGSFLQETGANPGRAGHRMAAAVAATVAETRLALARLLNAEAPERVIFAHNATDALNTAILGLLRPGDRAITTGMEHNSVVRPLALAAAAGAHVVKVPCLPDGVVRPADVAAAARDGARLIAVTHASNVTGAIQPIAALAEIARAAGAFLLVDGAQTVGALPVDVQQLGIDLLAFPGHKALMGPPGTGGLYIGPRVDPDDLLPLRTGGTGLRSEDDHQPQELPWRYESGTLNTVGIAALGAGLRWLAETGVEIVRAHDARLTARLIAGLEGIPGVTVYRPGGDPDTTQAAVVSFTLAGWPPAEIGAVLDQSFDIACRTGLHCAPDACRTIGAPPGGTVRLSPGPFTTDADIDAALSALREIASS